MPPIDGTPADTGQEVASSLLDVYLRDAPELDIYLSEDEQGRRVIVDGYEARTRPRDLRVVWVEPETGKALDGQDLRETPEMRRIRNLMDGSPTVASLRASREHPETPSFGACNRLRQGGGGIYVDTSIFSSFQDYDNPRRAITRGIERAAEKTFFSIDRDITRPGPEQVTAWLEGLPQDDVLVAWGIDYSRISDGIPIVMIIRTESDWTFLTKTGLFHPKRIVSLKLDRIVMGITRQDLAQTDQAYDHTIVDDG